MTRIFLEGWQRANAMPDKVVVSDCNAETLAKLKARFPQIETASGNSAAAAAQDIVFLAVHPPVMAEVVAGIKGSLQPGAIVVSLAPKFTIAKLTELLGRIRAAGAGDSERAVRRELRLQSRLRSPRR